MKRFISIALIGMTVLLWGNTTYIYAKASLAQILIAGAWQETLHSWPLQKTAVDATLVERDYIEDAPRVGRAGVKPWPWADTWPIARLRSSKLEQDLYVLAGAHGSALAFGPGHVDGTVPPGEIGSTVIAGHRDTHFEFLKRLKSGDLLGVQSRDRKWHRFRVSSLEIVDTRTVTDWYVDTRFDRLYLVTCYPFESVNPGGPLRYVATLVRDG